MKLKFSIFQNKVLNVFEDEDILLNAITSVRDKGVKIEESKFLKNSISSNKFNIIPKQ